MEKELKSFITSNPDDILELTELSNLYNRLILMIDDLYDNLSTEEINLLVTQYNNEYKSSLSQKETKLNRQVEEKKLEIADIQGQMKVLSVLENRPNKCKIDSCPFISDAISLKKTIKEDPIDTLSKLQEELLTLSGNLSEIQEKIIIYDTLVPKYMKLGAIRALISENITLINKYNPGFIDSIEIRLSESNPFNDIRDCQNIITNINILKAYKTELDNNKILEIEYKNYQEKVQILNANKAMEEKLNKEKENLDKDVINLKNDIDNYQSLIESLESSLAIQKEYANILFKMEEPKKGLQENQDIINKANEKSKKAIELSSEINNFKTQITQLGNELKPIVDNINSMSGQLTLLDSYYSEYNEYKRSYDIIETIKKYCSPTGGGIQTLFMQLYMSKTLEISNNILSMLFGGEYQLLDFVINENEFRIPFIGSGLPVDDISSGSSSQISIMGMIINLVLLHQASTKFNIARLDEIDAGLDSRNRSDFITFIYQTINLLHIEQVFMISHSIEADNTNADIIKLKTYDNFEGGIQSGNIIYDYNEHI